MIFHPGALLVYGAVLALSVKMTVQSPSGRSWRRLSPRGTPETILDLSLRQDHGASYGHLGSALSSPYAAEDRSVLTGGPSHLDQATTNPPPLGGPEVDPVTSEHADSAVSSREKEDAHAYIGRLSRLEPVTTKPPFNHGIRESDDITQVLHGCFEEAFQNGCKTKSWLGRLVAAGIKVWEGQHMEISELVDHTLDFLNQQNKVSLEYFTFAFQKAFQNGSKTKSHVGNMVTFPCMHNDYALRGQAGLKLLQGQHTESSVLADHTLKFLDQNKNTFSEWLGGEYEEMRKQSLAKEFDPVTLEESIEFYYPSIHEDQRQSVLRFALGLRVVEKEKPSLDHQWTLEDLKKLFKHWDDIAGPKKMTPWVTMSLKDFNEVTHKVLGFEPDVQDAKDNYFKSLLSWDLREEHQKFSLEELIHYTTLVMREEKILSGLWVWRNEIYFIDVQNMLMEQYLWHIKLLSNKENFPLENLGAGKLAKLFHEWKSGVKEHGEISLESKVLSRTTNGIQDGPGKESAPVPESLPGTWLEDSVEGKMRLSHEKEGAHAYLGRLSHLEPVNTQPPSSTASQEATVSLKYFCVASKRLFKMDEKQTVSLENWLQRDAGIFDLPQGRHNKISELVDSTFDFLKQNNKYLFFELLGIDSDSEWKKKESLARGFDPVDKQVSADLIPIGRLLLPNSTLEESIEFYYPSINKVQRQAVLRFAEGLRAVNEKEPSLDYDLKKLFKHWDDIAGPGKNTPQVMMSLKEFNKHAPTIFTYDPVNQDDINNYLKSLLSWDIGDEHQKFSLEELIHYTTLAIKEREMPSPEKLLEHSDGGEMQTSSDISSGEANAPLKPQWERNKELLEQLFRSHPTLSQEDKDSFQQFAREKHVVEIDSGETLDFNRLQGWYKEWNGTQRRRPFMASLKNWWHRVLQFWQKILGLGKK
ncbi:hypothetical protein PSHT_05387 [Puccinia striiformis]|uniref:Uncharacterized protein n=1 Tax=Puccinia striiformis TaxID=27350 RepID=A0A2S4WAI6_9BASI|nr:hypothetical protein PSHT_05387 [Puccinia striiformis]